MTHFDYGLINVVDVTDLNLKVGHPNGTEAIIRKTGNLKLTNNLILFDVLVIPQYTISLLSVHKIARDSKLTVVFDEFKCYIQDLNLIQTVGTGSERSGLYFFDELCLGNSALYNNNLASSICYVSKQIWHNIGWVTQLIK